MRTGGWLELSPVVCRGKDKDLNHCAGQQAYVTLAQAFGEAVAPCPVGTSFEF